VVSRWAHNPEMAGSIPAPATAPIQGQATSCHGLEIERLKGRGGCDPRSFENICPIKNREFYILCFFVGLEIKEEAFGIYSSK